MDLNYNLLKLEEKIDEILNSLKGKKNNKKLKQLIDDLLSKKDTKLIDKESKEFLNNYSKDAISLVIEKRILLAIENKSLADRKSYWLALKDRAPKISVGILSHFYDDLVTDINDKFTRYNIKTIDEINETYDTEIKNNLEVFDDDLTTALDSVSSVSLDHMENLNANGRVLSVDGVRKGGIFLSKDSNISYGKFVNKDEFLSMINKLESNKIKLNGKELAKEDLEKIVSGISQKLEISKNEKIKNQDARNISIGEESKKAGTLFFGRNGLDLPNGEYVSVDEINAAINQFVNGKNELAITKEENRKVFTVKKIKYDFKRFATSAAVAVSMLVASISGKQSKIATSSVVQESQNNIDNNDIQSNISTLENQPMMSENTISVGSNSIEQPIQEVTSYETPISDNSNSLYEDNVVVSAPMESQTYVENNVESQVESGNELEVPTETQEVVENNVESKVETSSGLYSDIDLVEFINQNVSGQDISNYAMKFVGMDYQYGGRWDGSENYTATDCSGFVHGVYHHFGIEIPRSSGELRQRGGINIGTNINNAVPGDILCFDGHVGIYAGGGQMIHASGEEYGVKYSPITKPILAIVRSPFLNKIEVEYNKTR